MKNHNDVLILATLAAPPAVRNNPSAPQNDRAGKTRPDDTLQLTLPLAWVVGGTAHVIVASAISATARAIVQHLQPGEPVMVTGTLDRRAEGVRLRLSSIQRLVTTLQTVQVPGLAGRLLALDGGWAEVDLRGHSSGDSQLLPQDERDEPQGVTYLSRMTIMDNSSREHHFQVRTPVPARGGQAVAIKGRFERPSLVPEAEGVIIATRVELGERLTAPANLSIRDPKDRLDFKVAEQLTDASERVRSQPL